jgi:hypothetical protein
VFGPEVPKKLSAHTLTTPASGEDSRIIVASVITSTVNVIKFFVFAVLFAIFLANAGSLCITLLIPPIFLNIMQIGSVGLWANSSALRRVGERLIVSWLCSALSDDNLGMPLSFFFLWSFLDHIVILENDDDL